MKAPRKAKVSVTLPATLLAKIDREVASRRGESRSSIIEAWLADGALRGEQLALERDTIAYYESLTGAERTDDARFASALSASAKRLQIDRPSRPRTGKRS